MYGWSAIHIYVYSCVHTYFPTYTIAFLPRDLASPTYTIAFLPRDLAPTIMSTVIRSKHVCRGYNHCDNHCLPWRQSLELIHSPQSCDCCAGCKRLSDITLPVPKKRARYGGTSETSSSTDTLIQSRTDTWWDAGDGWWTSETSSSWTTSSSGTTWWDAGDRWNWTTDRWNWTTSSSWRHISLCVYTYASHKI